LLGARVQAPGIMLWRGIFHQLGHAESPPPAFLHGHIAVGGWWYYYLDVCALKVPLGTLALVGLTLARLRPGNGAMRDAVVYLAAPVVVVIAAVAWTRIDLGIRLILPAVPFGLVLASRAAGFGERRWRYAAAGALAATLVSSAFATTNELSYFNEAARVLGGGERWLSDSNLDWGQDLDRLAGYLREHDAPPVYLAYFGGGSPTYLGIRHASLPTVVAYPPNADIVGDRDEPLAPCQAERELVAISTLRRQGVPELSPHRYEWLEAQTPLAELGQIRVYDVTSDLESHVQLATIYGIDSPTGLCERSRAIALDPRAAARFANRH